jgi:RNase H-fold protein (predicted Holliday junction resolvase)
MTSVQAERLQGKNAKSDSSAAALILQAYLDKK